MPNFKFVVSFVLPVVSPALAGICLDNSVCSIGGPTCADGSSCTEGICNGQSRCGAVGFPYAADGSICTASDGLCGSGDPCIITGVPCFDFSICTGTTTLPAPDGTSCNVGEALCADQGTCTPKTPDGTCGDGTPCAVGGAVCADTTTCTPKTGGTKP